MSISFFPLLLQPVAFFQPYRHATHHQQQDQTKQQKTVLPVAARNTPQVDAKHPVKKGA